MIWLALLIPVLVTGFLFVFYPKYAVWWEFVIPFAASIVTILILNAIIQNTVTSDTEYHGHLVERATYYEPWDEYIHKTCTRTVSCGKNCTTTQTYDCSYVKDHPAAWEFATPYNQRFKTTRAAYNHAVRTFQTSPVFRDMGRDYHRNDGDAYYVIWPETYQTSVPFTVTSRYENRVKQSKDVFNYPEVDEQDIELYNLQLYPDYTNSLTYPSLLPDSLFTPEDQKLLAYQNGLLGYSRQLRMWVILNNYPTNQAGFMQEALWVNGHKNEFVVVIGTQDYETIDWVHVFSWTEEELLKIRVRNYVANLDSLDIENIISFVSNSAADLYVRKEFKDFDYLHVATPLWALLLTYGITFLVNIGVIIFIIKNDYTE